MYRYTQEQYELYYSSKLKLQGHGREQKACCPFHDDRNPSLSVNFEKGAWWCFVCCVGGGPIEFQMRLENLSRLEAKKKVDALLGLQVSYRSEPEAVYAYRDEFGKTLYRKVREYGKRFSQVRVDANGDERNGLEGVRHVLYNLPRVLTSNYIIYVEGEKDVCRLESLNLEKLDAAGFSRFCATTQDGGAGGWRREYSPYFTGKQVAILPDFDKSGSEHARLVAESVAPYAVLVKIVELPGLGPGEDVSDFLDRSTSQALIEAIQKTPVWKSSQKRILIPVPEFLGLGQDEITWLVENVIDAGSNGFICAVSKGGKSWVGEDLCIALAMGLPWLDFRVFTRHRVALISREDNPGRTRWRIRQLLHGHGLVDDDLGDRFYINTREQSDRFLIDDSSALSRMTEALKDANPEIAFFDVFNVMHQADENDNTEMRVVLQCLSSVQQEVGCSICVLHHYNKDAQGTMMQRLRGSSAIGGWAEWMVGLDRVGDKGKIRKVEFESKTAEPQEERYLTIESDGPKSWVRRTDSPASAGSRRKPADLLSPT